MAYMHRSSRCCSHNRGLLRLPTFVKAFQMIKVERRFIGRGLTDLANVDSWVDTGTDVHYNICAKNLFHINLKVRNIVVEIIAKIVSREMRIY